MTYQALYRQWRPQTFAELVGQEHVTKTLQNALRQGKLAHAYLFCGSRGTGKTSAAKILAKAVNCEQGESVEPCNQCAACQGIQAGRVMDVLEIDAASTRGIDEIRDLREKARYAPVEVRKKVYIIDEVHMLTAEAFNALLKTLEEPPNQVLFILATTEPHKLPATITSRCQRLDFRLIDFDVIKKRLAEVIAAVGRACEEDALNLIAEEAAGSLRDALSLLEQVLAYAQGTVSSEDVLAVLGTVGRDVFYELTAAILNRDLAKALLLLQDVAVSGKDFQHFTQQAILYFRDLMVVLACGERAERLGIAADWAPKLYQQAQALGLGEIGRILSILHELLSEIRWSNRPRLLWELAVFKIFAFEDLAEPPTYTQTAATTEIVPEKQVDVPQAPEVAVPQQITAREQLVRQWPRILDEVKKESIKCHALLLSGELGNFDGKNLEICFEGQFHYDMMEGEQNKKYLENVLERIFGKKIRVCCSLGSKPEKVKNVEQENNPEELIQTALEIFRGQLIDESEKE
ncbi:MAG: DNA polymerase III subunit gamma/tau [Firmicutes bacterium]|nr:DNA polymerase III subunit gamma/tau [Bacillota bacterium]